MQPIEMKKGIYWVGGIDWDLRNFHGYLTQRGSTYNAYLIIDEKITLIDTVNQDGGPWPAGSGWPGYYSMERVDSLAPDSAANWASRSDARFILKKYIQIMAAVNTTRRAMTAVWMGAGYLGGAIKVERAARPAEIVDPRRDATPELRAVFERLLQRLLLLGHLPGLGCSGQRRVPRIGLAIVRFGWRLCRPVLRWGCKF